MQPEHVREFALVSRLKALLELFEEDEGVLACDAHDVVYDETDDRDPVPERLQYRQGSTFVGVKLILQRCSSIAIQKYQLADLMP